MKLLMIIFFALSYILVFSQEPTHTQSFNYDSYGRLIGVTYSDGSAISYVYDLSGNLINKNTEQTPSSVDQFNSSTFFLIEPNPANHYVEVEISDLVGSDYKISVFNSMGSNMLKSNKQTKPTGSSLKFNVNRWPAGTYFITLHSDKIFQSKKLVIIH